MIDWQQKCRWQRPWPGETGVDGWLINKEVPVIHMTNSFTITGVTDPKAAASSAASQLNDNGLFFSKTGKRTYPGHAPQLPETG